MKKISPYKVIAKERFVGGDESDEDFEIEGAMQLSPATRLTRRTERQTEIAKEAGQLGVAGTIMNVLKGFICTAILFLPKELKTGGWAFMIFALVFSCFLTIYCAQLLLEVKKHVDSTSYTDIGE